MPGGDRTGPSGFGSRTGRGLGYCAGYDTPGYSKGYGMGRGGGWWRGGGLGFGRGPGRGRGYGRGWNYGAPGYYPYAAVPPVYNPYAPGVLPTISPENELAMLKQDKDYLSSEMEGIKRTLDDISKKIEDLEKEK